jgi:hypothetical protein
VGQELISNAGATVTVAPSQGHRAAPDRDQSGAVALTRVKEVTHQDTHAVGKAHTHLTNRPLHISPPLTSPINLNTIPHL